MPMRIGTPMPSLDGATEWISGSAEEALKAVLAGKEVAVKTTPHNG